MLRQPIFFGHQACSDQKNLVANPAMMEMFWLPNHVMTKIQSPCYGYKMFSVAICVAMNTTTTGGYFAIRISSQTTKKKVSKSPLL